MLATIHMNIFRLAGDIVHLVSFYIMLVKLRRGKTAAGISLKSQELYALVFTCRYIDILWNFHPYNTLMKLFFLSASYYIVYMIRVVLKHSYDKENDVLKVEYLLGPCFVLALIFNYGYEVFEILWAFSIYLEAVAIMPQMFMLQKSGEIENLTSHYVFAVGAYRAFYLINWIYRFATEPGYSQWIVWVAGTVQTGLFVDFFYHYVKSKRAGVNLKLPA